MLTILIGRAKTGKSNLVLRRIAELGDSSRQILLVPEHASHLAEVDLCRVCGPTVSRHAEVLSFSRLCDRVLAAAGGGAEVELDAGGKLLMLQKAVSMVSPELKVYRRPSRKPAFLQQMMDLMDELRCYEVTPQRLWDAAEGAETATAEKLRDLSVIFAAYDERLSRSGMRDRDKLTRLCEKLEASGYVRGKDIFLDGFTYFNSQERRVLEILLRRANSVTVTLLAEPNSRQEIFAMALKTMGQLEAMAKDAGKRVEIRHCEGEDPSALGHLERHFFGQTAAFEGDISAIRLRQAESIYSEVEETAADILRLVAEGKCRFRDITVSARNMQDYMSTIETVFERYGIPVYLSRRTDILEKPMMSLLTGVLSAMGNGYEYEDMFRWLKTGLAGLTAEECDRLENYVLKWEIHGNMWLRDVDWTEHPDGYGAPWNEARQAELARINALRRRVREVLLPLAEGMKAAQTARGKVEFLYGFIEKLGLCQALESQMRALAEAGHLQAAEETAQLWDILCGVLDQFVEILGDEVMDLEEFTRLFRQILTQYSVGTIPVSLDQVSVSEITRNDRHSMKYLFLLGVNDHVIPGTGQTGGILNSDDRDALSLQGVELAPGGMEVVGMELQYLYAALAQPTEGLTVSYPVSDVSGTELRPAFVINRIRKLFPDIKLAVQGAGKQYRLTAIRPALEAAGRDDGRELRDWFAEKGDYGAQLAAMARAADYRRGALSPDGVQALYGRRISMSASRAERLRSCHFAYFMEYGLRAKPRKAAAFDAPQIGTFLHFLLENVTAEVMSLGGFGQVQEETIHALVRDYIDRYVARELQNFQEKSPRFRYLFSRLRSTAYAVMDQVAEELRHSDFVPLEFELSFGDGKPLPAVVISEPGAEVRLGGKVDRVDGWIDDDKLYLRVVDYKSGRKAFDLGAVRMGLDIQMLLYLFTLQKSGKDHFGKDIEPAGILYLPARDEVLSASRFVTLEKLAAMREKELRRSGLVLAEPAVLRAMEHEALEQPHFLPLNLRKDGSISGSIASAAQLGKLSGHVEKVLHEITREIRDGNIDADPCCKSEEDTPCRYCDWAEACHFSDGRGGDHLRYILPVKPEEFWKELEEGD